MPRVFIIATESDELRKLQTALVGIGFDCLVVPYGSKAIDQLTRQSAALALLNVDGPILTSEALELAGRIRQERNVPVIALISREKLNGLDSSTSIDDFVVRPLETAELMARIKRVLKHKESIDTEDIIKCGDLVINLSKCEVSLGGKPIILTFREYQLLKFLASNKGKVFTRDVLLDKVWGWDYYGGDRTVDVHIRRLRSKIEDSEHSFIDTVRNIGYRFRDL